MQGEQEQVIGALAQQVTGLESRLREMAVRALSAEARLAALQAAAGPAQGDTPDRLAVLGHAALVLARGVAPDDPLPAPVAAAADRLGAGHPAVAHLARLRRQA